MVQAILGGRKTMTRRIYKPEHVKNNVAQCPYGKPGDILWVRETWCKFGDIKGVHENADTFYYKADYPYSVDECIRKWRPSIFMPREACRIKLLIKDIRIERLQDITEDDAKAEGVTSTSQKYGGCAKHRNAECPSKCNCFNARENFADLWDNINAKRGYCWGKNPWVWVVSFERMC